MERKTISVGGFEVNCTILIRPGAVWIVDPGQEADRLATLLERDGLRPDAILLTHGHFDHIGGIAGLQARYEGLPLYVHPADVPVLTHPLNQLPPEYPPLALPANVCDARSLTGVEVLETPGHTPGGVCYHFAADGLLLSGDTLFAGSVGRTDLPGGDMKTLMASLHKLMRLPDGTTVVPGHGPSTTIGAERRQNPFLWS